MQTKLNSKCCAANFSELTLFLIPIKLCHTNYCLILFKEKLMAKRFFFVFWKSAGKRLIWCMASNSIKHLFNFCRSSLLFYKKKSKIILDNNTQTKKNRIILRFMKRKNQTKTKRSVVNQWAGEGIQWLSGPSKSNNSL